MKRLPGIILLILIASQSLSSQTIVSFDLQKNSSLTIYGSTNLLSFKLFINGEKLPRQNFTITATQNRNRTILSENLLSIDVKDFTSDNKMALRDFLKLIKSDIYPNLQVQLISLEILPDQKISKNFQIVQSAESAYGIATVSITITGVTKQYSVPITFDREGNLYSVDGNKKISIRDFGLIPPVQIMGLIKVSEWIEIHFHIIGKISFDF